MRKIVTCAWPRDRLSLAATLVALVTLVLGCSSKPDPAPVEPPDEHVASTAEALSYSSSSPANVEILAGTVYGVNYGYPNLCVSGTARIRQGGIKYALPSLITFNPGRYRITSATLQFTASNPQCGAGACSAAGNLQINRLLGAFNDYGGTNGNSHTPSNNGWPCNGAYAAAGGALSWQYTSAAAAPGAGGTVTFDVTADVQAWADGSATNNGWAVTADSGVIRLLNYNPTFSISYLIKLGQTCTTSTDCEYGGWTQQCVDGVCCDADCSGTCQACSAAKKGTGANGVCGSIVYGSDPDDECPAQGAASCGYTGICNGGGACEQYSAGTTCRASGGGCDPAETCPGGGAACPANSVVPAGGSSGGACTNQGAASCGTNGLCDGAGGCQYYAGGTTCRAAVNTCDLAETCPGGGAACPANAFVTAGQASGGLCAAQGATTCGTNGLCNGSGGCQYYAGGTTCRAAANGCDLAETCPGGGAACPTNAFKSAGAASAGFCPDTGVAGCGLNSLCDGSGSCQLYPAGSVCRGAANACDVVETCPGGGAGCPNDVTNPQPETCNGVDDNCNGSTDEGCDNDGDLFCDSAINCSAGAACACTGGVGGKGGDCNDAVAAVKPGATEVCDNVDNNCAGSPAIDEGCDDDGDDWCDASMSKTAVTVTACPLSGTGTSAAVLDCDDTRGQSHPGAAEVCDGLDNDCNGSPDQPPPPTTTCGVGACQRSGGACVGGVPTGCTPGTPTSETCNGVDDDCNGVVDNGLALATCGVGACAATGSTCNPASCTAGTPGTETCNGIDDDCNGVVDNGCDDDNDDYCDAGMTVTGTPATCSSGGGDCNDTVAAINPGASEICDNLDNNCAGSPAIDEGCDDDNDNYCDVNMTKKAATTVTTCSATPAAATSGDDCNDAVAAIKPGAAEICDNVDNDCAGTPAVDSGCDDDNDEYCDSGVTKAAGVSVLVCTATPAAATAGDDCDDTNAQVNPGRQDVCDDVDNDCAAGIDQGCDDDGDGYCDASKVTVGNPASCPSGGGDCNDTSSAVHPGAGDVCNGIDDNCTAGVDEGCDKDGDHYCDVAKVVVGTPSTCNLGGGDCDDTAAAVNPGATEICDNIDNNCAGAPDAVDEGCDDDNDDYCDSGMGKQAGVFVSVCQNTPNAATQGDDCNDTSGAGADVHPGVIEICDNVDNDCALGVDDGCDDDNDDYCDTGKTKAAIAVTTCTHTAAGATSGDDCEDTIATAHPGGTETCNDVDDDCSGGIDEGCDDDGDGYCDKNMTVTGSPAKCPSGANDCDDTKATTNPGATELCDAADNDCDGQTDENIPNPTCGVGECVAVATGCINGVPQNCTPKPPTTEICDGKDNDCNGSNDDGIPLSTCGLGECVRQGSTCDATSCAPGQPSAEICDGKDNDCNGAVDNGVPIPNCGIGACYRQATDCAASCTPGAPLPEICDGVDNDCDGVADDGIPPATCGTGACQRTGTTCEPSSCVPGAVTGEECNDLDDDCDGTVDNGCDDDGDGYCDAAYTVTGTPVVCVHSEPDCDDDKASVHPTADELCNDRDDDCDGTKDDNVANPTCGVGACTRPGTACVGGVAENCTPGTAGVEACNGIDDDCNDKIDDGIATVHCGVGECEATVDGCHTGTVPTCTPLDPGVETCNGKDDDCDGTADDGDLCGAGAECQGGACVALDGGAAGTGGLDGGPDSGTGGSGAVDAGPDSGSGGTGTASSSGDEGGCGCRAAGTRSSTAAWLAALVGLALLRRTRQRSRAA